MLVQIKIHAPENFLEPKNRTKPRGFVRYDIGDANSLENELEPDLNTPGIVRLIGGRQANGPERTAKGC